MTFLTKSDMNILLGHGPKLVSAVPMIRRQGNGNFTGLVRKTFDDGSVVDAEFVVNAKTPADVQAAYAA